MAAIPTSVMNQVKAKIGPIIKKESTEMVGREFSKLKKEMLMEFDMHPVTKELVKGPNARGSQFLNEGNLFGFIGFNKEDRPTAIIREMLQNSSIQFSSTTKQGLKFVASHPTTLELFAATPLPWATGRSWLKGIESGISGLGRYMYLESPVSRSGGGIQTRSKLKGSNFRNVSYISKILKNFEERIKSLKPQ